MNNWICSKSDKGSDVAVAIIQNQTNPYLYLLQKRNTGNGFLGWFEFPGGKAEEGETISDTLIREVHEEIGIEVTKFKHLTSMEYLYPSKKYYKVYFFTVTDYKGEPVGKLNQKLKWVALNEIINNKNVLPLNRAAALIYEAKKWHMI